MLLLSIMMQQSNSFTLTVDYSVNLVNLFGKNNFNCFPNFFCMYADTKLNVSILNKKIKTYTKEEVD